MEDGDTGEKKDETGKLSKKTDKTVENQEVGNITEENKVQVSTEVASKGDGNELND